MSAAHTPAAYACNGEAVSQAQFYAVACDPRRHVVVEACAGAGKTWMLVSRMLRALLEGAQPHEILAITFTKKAAGEMRARLLQWLEEFSRADDAQLRQALAQRGVGATATADDLSRLRGLHRQLLASGRPVQVRTFHSWFASIAASAPLGELAALGLPARYTLLEDDKLAIDQVWSRFYARVAADAPARADYVALVQTHGRSNTRKALESALAKRVELALADAAGVLAGSVATAAAQFPEFAAWEQPLDCLRAADATGQLWAAAKVLGAATQQICLKAAGKLEKALTGGDTEGLFGALLTDKYEARRFNDTQPGIEHVRQAQDLLLRVRVAQSQHDAWEHQQRLTRLSRGLLQDYAALKRERGWLDMNDLEQLALHLMSDPVLSGWVQEKLDARVAHVLIDEFQDTSPLQWQALKSWLAAYSGAGYSPGVFIVGDPKQSIYRFRRAEPQVFQAAIAFVQEQLGGAVLRCDHTRRNAPAVLDCVNRTFVAAQEAGQFEGFRPHTTESQSAGQVLALPPVPRDSRDSRDSRAADAQATPAWRDSLHSPRYQAEEDRKVLECAQAARWIAAALQDPARGLKPQDVMVLARKRALLGPMQQALAGLGVPAEQVEKRELAEVPEVQDLLALVDALVSPGHDLSLAQALKSPVFGVDDADLVALARHVRAQRDAASAQKLAAPGWLQTLQSLGPQPPADLQLFVPIAAQLARWQALLLALPPHDALSQIFDEGDVLTRYAQAVPPERCAGVLAHLRALLLAALQVDAGRFANAYALVRALRAGGFPAPVVAAEGAVRLLTVHGAKGLEASLVVLLDTDSESPRADSMGTLVQWPGQAAHPTRFVFLASAARPPPCAEQAVAEDRQAQAREELNALYVALTRAESTVVMSSAVPRTANPLSWWALLKAAELVEASVDAQPAASPGREAAAGAVELRLVQRLDRPSPPPPAASLAPLPPDSTPASLTGQAMHRLLERLLAARSVHTSSPWSAADLAAVTIEFGLDAAQCDAAHAMALGILRGQGAWCFDPEALSWAGNEVGIQVGGRSLRIDRLVQRRDSAHWWVLDYKSSAAPEQDAELLDQLRSYRDAVARAYPQATVRAAFLTPQGVCIEPLTDSR
jgi:ATP-dependent helicase/nuclease subunit A